MFRRRSDAQAVLWFWKVVKASNGLASPCRRRLVTAREVWAQKPSQKLVLSRPAIQSQTPLTALLGVDGAKAWPAAAGPRVILGAVNHQKKVFTPASAVSKKGLKKPTAQFLARQSRGKKKGAASYKQHYIPSCWRRQRRRGDIWNDLQLSPQNQFQRRNAKSKTRTLLAQSAAALVRRP